MTKPNYVQTAVSSADYGFEITPSDSVDLPQVTRGVQAQSGGVIVWLNMFDDEPQIALVPSFGGTPIRARRIFASGTTATGLVGLA